MNHGKIKPPKSDGDFTERLNKRIGKLLGKKLNTKLPNTDDTIKNWSFVLVTFFSVLLLWGISGFYYLEENQYGLISQNGAFQKTVVGPDAGFLLPYPFSDIVIIDGNASDNLYIGKTTAAKKDYSAITNDLVTLNIDADFSYQIVDPYVLYRNHLQADNDIDMLSIQLVEQELHDYIAKNNANELLTSNLIVLSNQFRDDINQDLLSYGIKLRTFNLSKLQRASLESTSINISNNQLVESSIQLSGGVIANTQTSNIATQLINEANAYKREHITLANENVAKFEQLLPQYKINQVAIVDQLYYQLLTDVPINKVNKYSLLELSLPELLNLTQVDDMQPANNVNDTRQNMDRSSRTVDRSVNRERVFNKVLN